MLVRGFREFELSFSGGEIMVQINIGTSSAHKWKWPL